MKPTSVTTPMLVGPGTSKILPEPLGVVLVMGSWNFPVFTTIGPLVDIIAAGNCAVIKGSEVGRHSSRAMALLVTRYLDLNAFVYVEGAV